MQTELKREWLRQLLNICSGLLKEEKDYLQMLISNMDINHTVDIEEEDDIMIVLIQRGFIKLVPDSEKLVVLPQYLAVGEGVNGIGLEITVKLYEDEIIVSKGYKKFKSLRNDTVS